MTESGIFDFIKQNNHFKNLESLQPILEELYQYCEKNNIWAFFRECDPPNKHGWMWWLPSHNNYKRWLKVKGQLCSVPNVNDNYIWFNFYTRIIAFIAKKGLENIELSSVKILKKIKKIYGIQTMVFDVAYNTYVRGQGPHYFM